MNCLILKTIASQLSKHSLKQKITTFKNVRQLNTFNSVLKSEKLNNCLSQNKFQPIIRTISTSPELSLFDNKLSPNFVEQRRYKKGKKGQKRSAKEESSDDESDAEEAADEFDPDLIDGKAIGFQDIDVLLISIRLDIVLKSGLNMARTRVDEAFYNNLIRINGERVSKKSTECVEDDEIDFIKGLNQDNQNLIDVTRIVIKKIEDKMSHRDRIKARLRRFRTLTIENYEKDPYDGSATNIIRAEDNKRE